MRSSVIQYSPFKHVEKKILSWDEQDQGFPGVTRSLVCRIFEEQECGFSSKPSDYTENLTARRRSALVISDTELKLIAAAAIMGLSSSPKNGYRIPAAIGTPTEL